MAVVPLECNSKTVAWLSGPIVYTLEVQVLWPSADPYKGLYSSLWEWSFFDLSKRMKADGIPYTPSYLITRGPFVHWDVVYRTTEQYLQKTPLGCPKR